MQNNQKKEILDYNFPEGISLIEANAGTGKTFSIELIYLKALLELQLEVQQILLVTFTVEATQQMKKRIFEVLQRCHDFFTDEKQLEDFPLQQWLEKFQKTKLCSKEIKLLLQKALVHFNETAIFSIHSFATRMNRESFVKATIGTTSELRKNLEEDVAEELFLSFWVARILPNTDYANFCYRILDEKEKKESIKSFCNLVDKIDFVKIFGNSGLIEFPKNDDLLSANQFLKMQEVFFELKKNWQWEDLKKLLERSKQIDGVKNKLPTYVEKHFNAVQENFKTSENIAEFFVPSYFLDWFKELENAEQKNSMEKIFENNPAAQSLQNYIVMQNEFITFLRIDFLNFAKKKLSAYKKKHQLYTYNDIISSFHNLSKKQTLKASQQFKLVIMDEFQDTDEIQSQAFLNLFHPQNHAQQTRMILVGDPKQSIFRFRGGDIFTYLKMKEHFVENQSYRLDKNWRSQKEIVEMVNLLFQQPNSFLLDNLAYFPSSAVLKQSEGVFLEKEPQSAFKVWDCEWNEKPHQKGLGQENLENKILMHLAGEVSRMIALGQQGKLMLGKEKLEPNMICILVPTNENIYKVRQYLAKFGIYASATSKTHLLKSLEFLEFWNLLQAIFYYKDEKKIRTCLLSRLFGCSLSELYNLERGYEWEKILEEFREFHLFWRKKGFALMIEKLVREKKILKNLFNYGYRTVANFYHSLDFFLKQFQEKNAMESYEKILENILESELENSSQNNLRVESDTNAVRIMTIHNSKGLEFPIVFCPYLWKPHKPREKPVFFHSEEIENQKKRKKILSYDLSKDHLYQPQIEAEQEAENRRLLYVLLTRAKHQIHLYYSEDYACHKRQSPFVELLNQLKKTESFTKWNKCIEKLPLYSAPDFEMLRFPKTDLKKSKEWQRQIITIKESYSFSSLTNPKQSSLETVNKKFYRKTIDNESQFEAMREKEQFYYLPAGMEMGKLVHQVLDFWQSQMYSKNEAIQNGQEQKEHIKNFIRQQLPFFKIEKFWTDTLFSLCQKSYQQPLNLDGSQTSLSEIAPLNKIGEVRFYLKLKKTDLIEKVLFLFQKNPQSRVLQSLRAIVLQFTDKEFQKICIGVIDLIFFYQKKYYILDWKTNWLGERAEDYHSENLFGAMLHHNYFLQYFLYYLALEKFLAIKNSSYGIGGVFYLFIRGLSSENLKLGVYFDKMNYMQKKQ